MRLKTGSLVLAALLALAVRPAAADAVLTGTIGESFSGDLDRDHLSYGGSIGFMGSIFGFEAEGTYSPDVFVGTGSNNITTFMGNLVLAVPLGRTARIYASGGGGLMKFKVHDFDQFFRDVSRNDWGVDAGAGLMFGFGGGPVGIRGDIRYFRNVHSGNGVLEVDFGGFHYWRGSGGLTLRF